MTATPSKFSRIFGAALVDAGPTTSPAQAEIEAALEWYADIQLNLSIRFLDEFEAALERLRDNPWQYPEVHNSIRRAAFRHFPYGLIYRVHPAEVEIIACFHARRNPRRWQDRS